MRVLCCTVHWRLVGIGCRLYVGLCRFLWFGSECRQEDGKTSGERGHADHRRLPGQIIRPSAASLAKTGRTCVWDCAGAALQHAVQQPQMQSLCSGSTRISVTRFLHTHSLSLRFCLPNNTTFTRSRQHMYKVDPLSEVARHYIPSSIALCEGLTQKATTRSVILQQLEVLLLEAVRPHPWASTCL